MATKLMLSRFKTRLEIPDGVQVWLACLDTNSIHDALMRMRYSKPPSGMTNGFKLYYCTFGIGSFLMQVTVSEYTNGFLRRRCAPNITQNQSWDRYAVPVWPIYGNVVWPPTSKLGDSGVDAFSDRWKKFAVSMFVGG